MTDDQKIVYPPAQKIVQAMLISAQQVAENQKASHPEDVAVAVFSAVEACYEFITGLGAAGLEIRIREW